MKKVLVLDDDRELCEELVEILQGQGFAAEYCVSGDKGIEKIEEKEYDIVILDLKLPGKSGFELLQEIGRMDDSKRPMILVMTGSPVIKKTGGHEKILQHADDILEKPFDPEALFDKLGA